MKTISGGIDCSTPVSVSEAAAFLFKFISSETGASHAVNAYLRRANSAFDELVRLHSRSDPKKHRKRNEESETLKFSTRSVEVNQERSQLTLETKTKSGLEESEGRMGTELEEEQSNLAEETVNKLKKKKKEKEKDKNKSNLGNIFVDSDGKMRKTIKEYEKEQTDPSTVVVEDQKEKRNKKRKKSRDVDEEDRPKDERRSKKKRAGDVGN